PVPDHDPVRVDAAHDGFGPLPARGRQRGRRKLARGGLPQPAVAYLHDGREIGVLPVLLAGRREAALAEAGEGGLAGGRERVPRQPADDLLEQAGVDRRPLHAVAASRTQSYPFSSSSSARFLSPERRMRPPWRT